MYLFIPSHVGQQLQLADTCMSLNDASATGHALQEGEGQSAEGIMPDLTRIQIVTIQTVVPALYQLHASLSPISLGPHLTTSPCQATKSPPHLYRPLPELQDLSPPAGEHVPHSALTGSPPSSSSSPPPSDLVYGMFSRSKDGTTWNCEECKRVFLSQGSLRAHARIHTGERPYRCRYCHRTFCQASTLKSHERLHTGEKPYKCKHCGRSFTQSAGLRSHMKTHRYDNTPAL